MRYFNKTGNCGTKTSLRPSLNGVLFLASAMREQKKTGVEAG